MKLTEIAAGQRAALALAGQGPRSREAILPRGLRVRLVRDEERYWLQLARVGVPPSDEEMRICATAWGVEPGAEWARASERDVNPVTKHSTHWITLTTSWRESEGPQQQALALHDEEHD
jgi:hypothetical protein